MQRAISRTIGIITVAAVLSVAGVVSASPAGARTTDLPVITIDIEGKTITVGGTLVSGAVEIDTTTTKANASPVLFRLNAGVTAADFYAALSSPELQNDPNVASKYGSIVLNSHLNEGTSAVQTRLSPGEYVALDSTKRDASVWPHAEFTVAAAAEPASMPAADAKVRAIDFGFRGDKTLHVGDVVRFQNAGYVVHMIVGLRTRNADDAKEVASALRTGEGKVNDLVTGFASFLSPVSHGAMLQETLDVKPGWYVLACFMATQDGQEHTLLGMERVIQILK